MKTIYTINADDVLKLSTATINIIKTLNPQLQQCVLHDFARSMHFKVYEL